MKRKYTKIILPNGGRLYYTKNTITNVTYNEIGFRCGASCDTIPGIAHFCEHAFFLGTDKYDKYQCNEIESTFGFFNAYTSYRRIYFGLTVLNKMEEEGLNYIEHIINHATFKPENIESEKKVICQEIANYIDKNTNKAYYLNMSNLSTDKLFKNTVLGSEKSVKSITSKDLIDFKNKYFTANNLEIFVCSPMSASKVKKMVIKCLESKLPVAQNFERMPMQFYQVDKQNGFAVQTNTIDKNYIKINFVVNHADTEDETAWRYKLCFLQDYLNNYNCGIVKVLRHDKNLVYGASFSRLYLKDETVLTLSTECVKGNVNEVLKSSAEYIKGLIKNGLDEKAVQNLKKKQEYYKNSSEPRVSRLMDKMGEFLYYDKVIPGKKYKNLIKNTPIEEFNEVAKEIFVNPKISLTILGDIDKKDVMTKANFNKLFK